MVLRKNEVYWEVIAAEVQLFRSVLLFITSQKIKAFLAMRDSWKIFRKFERLLGQMDPDIESRVLLGLGIFYLAVSLVPMSIATLLKIAGF